MCVGMEGGREGESEVSRLGSHCLLNPFPLPFSTGLGCCNVIEAWCAYCDEGRYE